MKSTNATMLNNVPTILLLCTYYTPTMHLLYSYYTPTMHLLYSYYTPTILLLCSYYAPTMLLLYSYYAPTMLLLYSYHAPTMLPTMSTTMLLLCLLPCFYYASYQWCERTTIFLVKLLCWSGRVALPPVEWVCSLTPSGVGV